jgi:hypothetical protein
MELPGSANLTLSAAKVEVVGITSAQTLKANAMVDLRRIR